MFLDFNKKRSGFRYYSCPQFTYDELEDVLENILEASGVLAREVLAP